MIKKKHPSKEDLNTWKSYIKNPTDIIDKEHLDYPPQTNVRFKYDLHGYSLDEANKKVEEIILTCVNKHYREIIIITGKGLHSNTDKDVFASKDLSKLKFSVPEYINSKENLLKYVSSISKAEQKDGGEGALIIKLKKL
ncbi:MAG: DNA mismatch repair protein MutS [Candidatus Pelagibacter sp. TMED272]|nr:DNA mismatch repair protein MutS [Pelagibacteraceae bacterium]RPG93562.1 MAG: DNA mismatch repair protein MutS [Candidatus Pelagibacter sp. TMED272]